MFVGSNSSSGSIRMVMDLKMAQPRKWTRPMEQMLAKSALAVSTSRAIKSVIPATVEPPPFVDIVSQPGGEGNSPCDLGDGNGQRMGRISRRRNPPLYFKHDGGLRYANPPY